MGILSTKAECLMRISAVIAICSLLTIPWKSAAEVDYGSDAFQENLGDVAWQGRFFATSDYGFVPGKADTYSNDYEVGCGPLKAPVNTYIRGQSNLPSQAPSKIFPVLKTWLSGKGETTFGVIFDKPLSPIAEKKASGSQPQSAGQSFPPGKEVLVDCLRIYWGGNVPGKGEWTASITTTDGKVKELPVDREKIIYPYDDTTINFEPLPVREVYIKLKGERTNDYVEVRGIRIFYTKDRKLTSPLCVYHPDCYFVEYDRKIPGSIKKISAANPYMASTVQVGLRWPGISYSINPSIRFKGKEYFAFNKECKPEPDVPNGHLDFASGHDKLEYTLQYALPDCSETVSVKVTADFYNRADDAVLINLNAENLPEGGTLGISWACLSRIFGNGIETGRTFPGNQALILDSQAGKLTYTVKGADKIVAERIDGVADNQLDRPDLLKFDATAYSNEMELDISLPIGDKGKAPLFNNGSAYLSQASNGIEGYAPFDKSDLELIDKIDCGNPADPHICYDIANDPIIAHMNDLEWQKKNGVEGNLQKFFEYNPLHPNTSILISSPEKGKSSIDEILGRKCRVISPAFGSYFRYELNAKFERAEPYLFVFEHAFDQERRGTIAVFSDIADAAAGGLDTGKGSYDNKYKKESILVSFPHRLHLPSSVDLTKHPRVSLLVTNVWSDRGWLKAPGPAISKIEVYRIKRMPHLYDLSKLEPKGSKRSIAILTEACGGLPFSSFLYEMPQVVGYDTLARYTGVSYLHNSMAKSTSRDNGASGATNFYPGTLTGNEWLLKVAEEKNLAITTHLGELLYMGYIDPDRNSFTGRSPGRWKEIDIPLSPAEDEWKTISDALSVSLSKLAHYKSLKYIAVADDIDWHSNGGIWTYRNLSDFVKESGVSFTPSPVAKENITRLLDADPSVLKAWMKWASEKRILLHERLLDEIRKYRKDLYIVYNVAGREGHRLDLVNQYYLRPEKHPFSKEKLAEKGIVNFSDYLRFSGLDPQCFKGVEGAGLQLYAGSPSGKYRMHNTLQSIENPKGRSVPDYYNEEWFQEVSDSFTCGISTWTDVIYDEGPKPLRQWTCCAFFDRKSMRQTLIKGLLANAREIGLSSYSSPFEGRIDDVRRFAVPFRLLPFAKPEAFSGKIFAPESVKIYRYDTRYALINAGDTPVKVTLELPDGESELYDLSEGLPHKLKTYKDESGKTRVNLHLDVLSFKTLTTENL